LRRVCLDYYRGKRASAGTGGMVAAAYLLETCRTFRPEKAVSARR